MDQRVFATLPYIPGVVPKKTELLSRYLPPIPDGVISTWLIKNVPPGSLILDPFGASPRLAVEAARAGFRVLVTSNNPITRFLLEVACVPPKPEDLQSALAELAASYKAEERIEPHIRSLYNTHCARCGQIVSADAFIWEHGNSSPSIRIYTCPFCGDSGEHPCTIFDSERMKQFSSSGLHKARALERVVTSTDQDRIHVEQALSVYLPRALYALITIVNKIEGLNIPSTGQKYLAALLLHAFDQANAMWRVPSSRERRRQLTIPRHFRENNIWVSLEQGIDILSNDSSKDISSNVPISIWPELPQEDGGICVYEGRLVSIIDSLPGLNIKSVCAAIPRPNQAFWTLSALWAGWLWGREAVGSFKSVLHRQRYDWAWHTTALASVFKQLSNILEPTTSILGLLGEAEPGFIASTLVAAGFAGCDLQGVAIRDEEDQTQIVWKCKTAVEPPQVWTSLSESGIESARTYLESRGEPASYLNTISAAFISIIQSWVSGNEKQIMEKEGATGMQSKSSDSANQSEPSPSLTYSRIYNTAREALSYRSGFLRYNLQDLSPIEPMAKPEVIQNSLFSLELGKIDIEEDESPNISIPTNEVEPALEKERPTRSSDVSESVLLWLRTTDNSNHMSISDGYEINLLSFLKSHPGSTIEDIDIMLCEKYKGLYTPDAEFIRICLDSYGEKDPNDNDRWHLRPEDEPGVRQRDLENARNNIRQIGVRLGLSTIDHQADNISSISWDDSKGQFDLWFFPIVTANIGEIIFFNELLPGKGFVVIPGSRANLIIYKLRRDPRLNKAFTPSMDNWHFLKFRHLRSLAENPLLNLENLDQLLFLDPLTYSTLQLRLI
jgi:hypothetical protein